MACYEYLSEFTMPYKWGTNPCEIVRINYDTNVIETIELTDGYTLSDDCVGAIRLYWLNSKGGIDSFMFNNKVQKGVSISDGIKAINNSAQEFFFDKGVTRTYLDIESQVIFAVDVPALITICSSPKIWWDKDGEKIDVNIEEGEYLYADTTNRKLTVTFRLTLAQLKFTQLR